MLNIGWSSLVREAGIGLARLTMRCAACGHEATAVTHPSRKQATVANANTEHHAALFRSTPPAPQQATPPSAPTVRGPGERTRNSSTFVKWVGGVLSLLLMLAAWGAVSRLFEHSSVSNLGDVASSQYDCEDLASDAVDNSSDSDTGVQLLKKSAEPPDREGQPQQLRAALRGRRSPHPVVSGGTGVWSSGGDSPVLLRDTVDADGDEWVEYRPASSAPARPTPAQTSVNYRLSVGGPPLPNQ